jgi:hypothetical protein
MKKQLVLLDKQGCAWLQHTVKTGEAAATTRISYIGFVGRQSLEQFCRDHNINFDDAAVREQTRDGGWRELPRPGWKPPEPVPA